MTSVSYTHLDVYKRQGMYPKKKISEQLIYFAELRGMEAKNAKKAAGKWLERLEMGEYFNKRLDTLSKGNQQKIQLAATLISDPDIVILDEPFSGLDPVNAELLKSVVLEQIKLGKLVLFSSHQMNYVEEFCDTIAILNNGKIAVEGNLENLKRSYDKADILISADKGKLTNLAKKLSDDGNILKSYKESRNGMIFTLSDQKYRGDLLQKVAQAGISPEKFEVMLPTLQDIFVEYAG